MSVTESVKTVAARCSKCGADIITEVNYFQLAFQKINVKCDCCGETSITLNAEDGDQVLISVPCAGCGEGHSFTRKLDNFFKTNEDIFRFMCPFAGIEICFVGEPERVVPALDTSRQELIDMISEYQRDSGVPEEETYEKKEKERRELAKAYIKQLIYDCADIDMILCQCKGMDSTESLSLYEGKDYIKLTCKSCGRSIKIKITDIKLIERIDLSKRIEIKD